MYLSAYVYLTPAALVSRSRFDPHPYHCTHARTVYACIIQVAAFNLNAHPPKPTLY